MSEPRFKCDSLGVFGSAADLRDAVVKVLTGPFFTYSESIGKCMLAQCPDPRDLVIPEDGFEGHVFDQGMDVRWARISDGNWRAWKTVEDAHGIRVHVTSRRHYLIGEFLGIDGADMKVGLFGEDRFPASIKTPFRYPLPDGRVPEKSARAFIEVKEYRRVIPDSWAALFGDRLDRELDEPLLVGHRFWNVGTGSGR